MKGMNVFTLAAVALIAGFLATGCKTKNVPHTPLPPTGGGGGGGGGTVLPPDRESPGRTLPGDTNLVTGPTTLTNLDATHPASKRSIADRPQDRAKWTNQTVHFEFDSSVIKASETAKLDTVAREFKSCPPESDILIEGHCDERGTPEYNRALGERRATALREYLIRAGVNSEYIHTVSFGKDKPAALGHDPASWTKNRRGEFILVLPKT
jgi:peptidoglycan-associated lipoprotein